MNLNNVKIEKLIFKNDANGFAILACEHNGRSIRIKGSLSAFGVGAHLNLEGEWRTHPKYGEAFEVRTVEEIIPKDTDGIEKYLGSGMIKGIGKKTAELIVKQFGDKALDILDKQPELLLKVKGISEQKLKNIIECWKTQREIKQVMLFLKSHDVSNAKAWTIYGHYGIRCISILKENPYQLADDVNGIGFVSADKIALNMGIKKDSAFRILAGLNYVINKKCEDDGCVYIEREDLISETISQLKCVGREAIEAQMVKLNGDDDIVIRDTKYYPAKFFYAEKGVAHRLMDMAPHHENADVNIKRVEGICGVSFEDSQKDAIHTAMVNRVCVMTGGPGTGKTTTTKGIITALTLANKKVLLAAPTGRAAKRMSEATEKEAATIHRLLEFSFENGFRRNEDNPLDADAVVVDEASMVDIRLMNNLLKGLSYDTQLIIVGDVDQLPSVGCGNCLHDMIESKEISVIKLTKIFRQAEGSDIIKNAHRINKGLMPVLNTAPESDFKFIKKDDIEDIRQTVISQYMSFLNNGGKLKDIQVLTPQKPGSCGIGSLNAELQQTVNPPAPNKGELKFMGKTFRKGDKVMQTKNNYEKNVFNGDIGFVISVLEDEGIMTVEFNGSVIDFKQTELLDMELAYASTIHKSQGSEFATVIIPMTSAHSFMHQRNLLYTAVTRAKKKCILIGEPSCVHRCVTNNVMKLRNSTLIEQMKDYDF